MAKKTPKKRQLSDTPSHPSVLLAKALKLHQSGKLPQAETLYRQILQQHPNHADAWHFLGVAIYQSGRAKDAITLYQRALALKPNYPDAHTNLGNAYLTVGDLAAAIQQYQQAINLKPQDADIYSNLGNAFIQQGQIEAAIQQYQQAITLNPNNAEAHNNLGNALGRQDRLDEAIAHYQKALAIQPHYPIAANNLQRALAEQQKQDNMSAACQKVLQKLDELGEQSAGLAELNQDLDLIQFGQVDQLLQQQNFAAARQKAQEYLTLRSGQAKVIPAIAALGAYAKSGDYPAALEQFLNLESRVQQQGEALSTIERELLYKRVAFCTPFLRDDRAANTELLKRLGQLYIHRDTDSNGIEQSRSSQRQVKRQRGQSLRIGFLSNHFKRSSVGWVSVDWMRELSKITPEIYCYATAQLKSDDLTQQFEQIASQFYHPRSVAEYYADPAELIEQVERDRLDILVSLDSLTIPTQVDVLQARPAPICITWPGFDAPFTSSENYYLCDWHTHPHNIDAYYREQLVRVPHAHLATAGFDCIPCDRDALRQQYNIDPGQVVFLCVAHGLKFTPDLVRSQLAILAQVPNSMLFYKGRGDMAIVRATYQHACEQQGLDFNRLVFLTQTKTEEEHRAVYILADILLDSYPYNGGVHNLEALWFELPLVTRKGHQFASRLGYSFLRTLDIETGIADSWETYIHWGIQLGQNADLRQAVRTRLAKAKQEDALAPLWNPRQYAKDFYAVLAEL